ncbi:hypothetical protein BgiBS90_002518 [Biomphalaria glabrata]|nr:hypothetical protein BgiBS90_002518 [Biomphalaria glabrata]
MCLMLQRFSAEFEVVIDRVVITKNECSAHDKRRPVQKSRRTEEDEGTTKWQRVLGACICSSGRSAEWVGRRLPAPQSLYHDLKPVGFFVCI